ncbi:HIT family protein [Flexivirga oryzae]|uniref:ATP adenylyltransferase n=1 Tax=Flexivirga oryzae TaxID=1794944 RepID=A0A839N4Y8_9MICO|nr:ATP adenylyltransferase [Flexivirga oryzae]
MPQQMDPGAARRTPEGGVEPESDFARVPDGFERLWTPHRMAYIEADKPEHDDNGACPFCAAQGKTDEEALIVHRGSTCFVILNLFPYNPGHLLICPNRHIPAYLDLTEEETAEFTALTKQTIRALKAASAPHGFNLGMNQGEVAGAGVAAHLHQHVVPRWAGDSNFLPIVGQTKALPVLLEDTRARLAEAWPQD